MPLKLYDKTSPAGIERFGNRLRGSTLRKTFGVEKIPEALLELTINPHTKGKLGQLVEQFYYGINPDNEACTPDFPEAEVELKTHPMKKTTKGEFRSKERLVLQTINFMDIVHESFEASCFLSKGALMMLVAYLHETDTPMGDIRFLETRLFSFSSLPEEDKQIIKKDWETVVQKVKDGKAHELHGSDTHYLEAATKGGAGQTSKQPYNPIDAPSRGFAFKQSYVNKVLNHTVPANQESAITDFKLLEQVGLEGSIVGRYRKFAGMNTERIYAHLGLTFDTRSKQRYALMARAMIGVKTQRISELENANITMKTLVLEPSGRLKESMSFPAFRYMGAGSILEEDWGNQDDDEENIKLPALKRTLLEKKFLFVVFQRIAGSEIFSHVQFWSMPFDDIANYVQPVWQQTKDAITTGHMDRLPGMRFNKVCHVRPHATKGETLPTPHNGHQIKRSFWLNADYIAKQLTVA